MTCASDQPAISQEFLWVPPEFDCFANRLTELRKALDSLDYWFITKDSKWYEKTARWRDIARVRSKAERIFCPMGFRPSGSTWRCSLSSILKLSEPPSYFGLLWKLHHPVRTDLVIGHWLLIPAQPINPWCLCRSLGKKLKLLIFSLQDWIPRRSDPILGCFPKVKIFVNAIIDSWSSFSLLGKLPWVFGAWLQEQDEKPNIYIYLIYT